jgi:acyl carrier protein
MSEKVIKIVAEQLNANIDDVTAESSIIDDLGADSLDVVDLVMAIEEEFDIEIPDEKVETMKTVEDIIKYVETNAEA